MIQLRNAAIGYGRRPLISCIDLKVTPGDIIFLSGPNGSGKSTLAKSFLGVLPLVSGDRINTFHRLAYVPQSSHFDVQYPVTVSGLIRQGLRDRYRVAAWLRTNRRHEEEQVSEILSVVNLTSAAGSLLREISGGQLQRALIGRALVGKPDFLLLDEPFSNLDRSGRGEIALILRKYASPACALCVIDHGDAIERSFYTRFLEIDAGHLQERNTVFSDGNQ